MLDEIGVVIAQRAQVAIDVAFASALADLLLPLRLVHPADGHARAVVEQDLHLFDVVVGLARHLRMRAAGVVADHAAKAAMVVRGRIGTPGQLALRLPHGRIAQLVAYGSGQHARPALGEVHLQHAVHVLRPVDDDGDIAALACQAGAASAREHRRAEAAAGCHGLHHVFFRLGNHHPDRHLTIVRSVDGVHRLAARVEAHLAFHFGSQLRFQRGGIYALAGAEPVLRARLQGSGELIRGNQQIVGGRHFTPRKAQAANFSAAARLSSSPLPGRDRSGCISPFTKAGRPSKSICSMRT